MPSAGRKSIAPARQVAHSVLLRVARDGAFADRLLDTAFERAQLDARDRALATELIYGTLRHVRHLDFLIDACVTGRKKKVELPVRVAMRLGLYQLLHTGVAPHAAIDEAVELAKKHRSHAAGMVNAILRKLQRAKASDDLPDPRASVPDPWEAMGIALSQPGWVLEEMATWRTPEQVAAWAEANNQVAPVALRINARRAEAAGVRSALEDAGVTDIAVHALSGALTLQHTAGVRGLPGFAEGHFAVQDPAAQLVGRMLSLEPEGLVLDLCAAPGGKAHHLAERMGGHGTGCGTGLGTVLACDLHPGRVRLIAQGAERLGLENLSAQACDATDAAALGKLIADCNRKDVDAVIVDAPCSGLGTMRRHPELRTRSRDDLVDLLALQRQLLDAAVSVTKPGGYVLYAVCTPTLDEGPRQVAALLERHPTLEIVAPTDDVPKEVLVTRQISGRDVCVLQTLTDLHAMDSFFAVLLRPN